MKTVKSKICVGKKPDSAKNLQYTGKDELIRGKYIAKITGKSSRSLKASC